MSLVIRKHKQNIQTLHPAGLKENISLKKKLGRQEFPGPEKYEVNPTRRGFQGSTVLIELHALHENAKKKMSCKKRCCLDTVGAGHTSEVDMSRFRNGFENKGRKGEREGTRERRGK